VHKTVAIILLLLGVWDTAEVLIYDLKGPWVEVFIYDLLSANKGSAPAGLFKEKSEI
jgi:hypothetical protein